MKLILEVETQNLEQIKEAIDVLSRFTPTEVAKEAHSVTETPLEEPKKENPTPRKGRAKKEPTEAPSEEPKSSITLEVLKESAKKAAVNSDRAKVREAIGEFGAGKLTDVKEEDYGKLYKKLQLLGK